MSVTSYLNQAALQTLPAGWTGAAAPELPQLITGTGAVEAANAVALTPGRFYIVKNVSATVLARFAGAEASGLLNVVNATTSATLAAGQEYKFIAMPRSRFIYAESAAGVYELVVWECDCVQAQP